MVQRETSRESAWVMVEEIRNKSFSQRSGVYSLFFKLEVSTFIPVNNLA